MLVRYNYIDLKVRFNNILKELLLQQKIYEVSMNIILLHELL